LGGTVPTVEERVAFLEGRVADHARGTDGIRDALARLDTRIDRRFEGADRRAEAAERRIGGLDEKVTRYFVWMIGIQVITLVAMIAALAAR
jgi:hypothetical protein